MGIGNDRGQKTDDREQKTDDREQKTDDREQKTENRSLLLTSVICFLVSNF